MDLTGLYSRFRYPDYELVGFSPTIAYLMSNNNFILELYRYVDSKNEFSKYHIYIYSLLDIIFHKTNVGVLITSTYRNPIYLIHYMH